MKMLKYYFLLLMIFSICSNANATFSIAAVDLNTGEVGVAGATCLNTGASIIGGLVPGIGAINSQSLVCTPENLNLLYALELMENGANSQEILDSLYLYDKCSAETNEFRQYGIALFNSNGNQETATFTGTDPDSFAGGVTGINYAIQGNILIDSTIIYGIETAFLNATGSFSDKLMAALQGAKVAGADSRCLNNGTSSMGSFIKVACHPDSTNCKNLFLDVFYLDNGVEPIDTLQSLYDAYMNNVPVSIQNNDECVDAIELNLDSELNVNDNLFGKTESNYPNRANEKNIASSDAWFKFTTASNLPNENIIIKVSGNALNLFDEGFGMDLYDDCNASANLIACSPSGENDFVNNVFVSELILNPTCLNPNSTYYLKVYSKTENWYTDSQFTITIKQPTDYVVWKEDFANGLTNWTTSGSPNVTETWVWDEDGFLGGLSNADIISETKCNGAAIFHADRYLTQGLFNNLPNFPYPIKVGELTSPSIDFTNVALPIISFSQHFAGLSGNSNQTSTFPNSTRGAIFQVSIDGGNSWIQTTNVNDDLGSNEFSNQNNKKTFELAFLTGFSDVKFNFVFNGDFYFWAIDDIIITDGLADQDNDGITDNLEDLNNNGDLTDDDTDGDGIFNYNDADDDGDGILTIDEDYNGNGDLFDDDSNGNNIPDFLDDQVSTSFLETEVNINFQPNPTQGIFKIVSENLQINQIKIFNSKGKEMQFSQINNDQIDLTNFAKGVYFVELSVDNQMFTKKLVLN